MQVITARITLLALAFSLCGIAAAEASDDATPDRIVAPVSESQRVRLSGNTHPLANSRFDRGKLSAEHPMEHVYVLLRRSLEQENALNKLTADLQNPSSPNYHKWLTADDLGRKFGPSPRDLASVTSWLTSHGLQVNMVHKSGMVVDISGNAKQIAEAFHTEMHSYSINGKSHIANASDPEIPSALSPVVAGVVSLHDFMPKANAHKPLSNFSFLCTGCPDGFDGAQLFDVAPADFATIYNVGPLYKNQITGAGQIVVVLEISNIQSQDVDSFRQAFGLSKFGGTFSQIHPGPGCKDPGINGEEGEAALDAEWAGAVAPGAHVELASCDNTATNFGAFIAAQNLLDKKVPPPIMSLSFSGCEAFQGIVGNEFINAMWQQAAVEGVSVFVSSGDGSAAGCDDFNTQAFAVNGIQVNALASTPFNFAAGGTDFSDTFSGTNSNYWRAGNSATGESAKSYIPEMTWEDSCGSQAVFEFFGFTDPLTFCNSSTGLNFFDIVGGSGGFSRVYPKPSWQSNTFGMPNDGRRGLPDVSLFASNGFWSHAIIFCMSDVNEGGTPCDYSVPSNVFFNSAGGTSFTAPQFASIQALINQKANGRQGNPAPIYYQLAKKQNGTRSNPKNQNIDACDSNNGNGVSGACIFHDVTFGSITVPCAGPLNCFEPDPNQFGVLSVSNRSLEPAFPTRRGWDFATGLGSPNVTNLVNNWP
jgi:subtilase family serine protease